MVIFLGKLYRKMEKLGHFGQKIVKWGVIIISGIWCTKIEFIRVDN